MDLANAPGSPMELFVKPIVRQYHHKGLIWRAPEAEEVRSYELFFDLIYVGIIAISGDAAAEQATGEALLRFSITFILGWKIWSDVVQFVSWFDADDVYRRVSVLFLLVLLLGLTTNMAEFLGETYTPAISFYIAARLFTGISMAIYAYMLPLIRPALLNQIILIIVSVALWIGSTFVEDPHRQALIWTAIMLDLIGHVIVILVMRVMKKWFEFWPAINIEHRIERTNAFVSLVFGYSVVSLLYQSAVKMSLDAYFGKAVLGLVQAYCFNWLYFEIDSFNLRTHAIRRHMLSCESNIVSFLNTPILTTIVISAGVVHATLAFHPLVRDSRSSTRADCSNARHRVS